MNHSYSYEFLEESFNNKTSTNNINTFTNVVPLASLSSFAGDREENFVNHADVNVLIKMI